MYQCNVVVVFFSGMVSALDEAVGNITDALRKRGYMNNSLIVFTSDVSRAKYSHVNIKLLESENKNSAVNIDVKS